MSINYLLQLLKVQFTQNWYPKALWVKTNAAILGVSQI